MAAAVKVVKQEMDSSVNMSLIEEAGIKQLTSQLEKQVKVGMIHIFDSYSGVNCTGALRDMYSMYTFPQLCACV